MIPNKLTRAFLVGALLVLLAACTPGTDTDDGGDDDDDDARVPAVQQLA